MSRRRGTSHKWFTGYDTPTPTEVLSPAGSSKTIKPNAEVHNKWSSFGKMMHSYLTVLYSTMNGNYVIIITILVVLLLSLLLPDMTQKAQATQELKNMKAVLDKISSEVKKAEVACLTVADDVCCLHTTMHKDAKESAREVQELSFCSSHHVRTTQSEPTKIEKKVGFFRQILCPNKNTSNKEVAIMSYVYTDSFDAKEQIINISQ